MRIFQNLKRDRFEEISTAYLFLLPIAVMWIAWFFLPLIQSFSMSLYDYNMLRPQNAFFVGLANYKRLFMDDYFWVAVRHTILFVLITVPACVIISLPIACLLNLQIKARVFFRAAYYVPNVVSSIAVTTVFMYLFVLNGVLTNFFTLFGINNVTWFANIGLALPFVMIIYVWQWAGFYIIIYLSGLQTISAEIFESAKIDGANAIQVFFRIIVPMLKPTLTFGLTYSIIMSFQVFDQIAALSQTQPLGSPAGATSTMVTFFYSQSFRYFNMGYGCAAAIMLFLLIIIVSLIQRRLTGTDEGLI